MSKILIVDDDQFTIDFLKGILEPLQYDFVEASSGIQVNKLIEDENLSLAIIDIIMPDKEGLETIEDLHSVRPDLPIIAMSSEDNLLFLNMATEMGARGSLTKPFVIEHVKREVSQLLDIAF